ncbi:MAG: AbrB/MazE/SpoVT family DNA-binding domain-containing protein [Patescibacteria group bacterium]
MGNKRSDKENIRKITKVGKGSLMVTLPIDLVRKLGWKEKQRVVVKRKGSKIIISDWKK